MRHLLKRRAALQYISEEHKDCSWVEAWSWGPPAGQGTEGVMKQDSGLVLPSIHSPKSFIKDWDSRVFCSHWEGCLASHRPSEGSLMPGLRRGAGRENGHPYQTAKVGGQNSACCPCDFGQP